MKLIQTSYESNPKEFEMRLKAFLAMLNTTKKNQKVNGEKYGLRMPDHEFSYYDLKQLKMGIKVEFEHLTKELSLENFEKASLIAMHHLDEMPLDYYTKLETIDPHH